MNRTPFPHRAPAPVSALFTDLYELTMLQAYLREGLTAEAVFTLFVRRLPPQRNALLACGLDTLLADLETLRLDDAEIAWLESLQKFSRATLDWLADFRFRGEVHAMPEGTPVFANEPILEVVAPLPEAQLIETLVMNRINLQTVLASKAVRVVDAARGRPVIDFGARRMQGLDAAVSGARAFHVAGVAGTSNVLAGRVHGVPVAGTMAHSYIQAHDDEAAAFEAFAALYPDTVLLVDTLDTLGGVDRVIALAHRLGDRFRVRAVRLDSGDLGELARATRKRLDRAGLERVQIFASGGLDEHAIDALLSAAAPVDAFGVGTRMGVSADAPDLDLAYKLCEYDGRARIKLSSGKPVLPGRKQVFRQGDDDRDTGDVIGRRDERLPGRALLHPVMRDGRRLLPAASLDALRDHARAQWQRLPAPVRALDPAAPPYPVSVSSALTEDRHAAEAALRGSSRTGTRGGGA